MHRATARVFAWLMNSSITQPGGKWCANGARAARVAGQVLVAAQPKAKGKQRVSEFILRSLRIEGMYYEWRVATLNERRMVGHEHAFPQW